MKEFTTDEHASYFYIDKFRQLNLGSLIKIPKSIFTYMEPTGKQWVLRDQAKRKIKSQQKCVITRGKKSTLIRLRRDFSYNSLCLRISSPWIPKICRGGGVCYDGYDDKGKSKSLDECQFIPIGLNGFKHAYFNSICCVNPSTHPSLV